MRHILVAVDESEASERVSEFVNRFFEGMEVSITALNVGSVQLDWAGYPAVPGAVYPWPYGVGMPPRDAEEALAARADAARESAEQTVASSGVDAEEQVVEIGGDVAETIRRVASQRGADLIVVGAGHKSLWERLISPSVSSELAKDAPRPVLVVH